MDFRLLFKEIEKQGIGLGDQVKVRLAGGSYFTGFYYGVGELSTDIWFHRTSSIQTGLEPYRVENIARIGICD